MRLSIALRGNIYLVLCVCLMFLGVAGPVGGHDWQRTVQIAIAVCAVLYLLSVCAEVQARGLVERPVRFALCAIFALGLVSSLLAHQPLWALTELALVLVCCAIAAAFAILRRSGDESLDRALVLFVLLVCLVKGAQYLSATWLAMSSAKPVLNTDLLLEGFSNKRFYGQFQTFTLPLLALPLLAPSIRRSLRLWVFVLLCVWWLIAISGGTRGTWLGMGVAAVVMAFVGRSGRRWLAWQLAAMLSGLLLYALIFSVLTRYLGVEVINFAGDRLTGSLSSREIIWWQAWDMIRERPLLGYGPMHFADIANKVAAHPHQSILQWACEWGVPSALCVLWLGVRGLLATAGLVRQTARSSAPVDLLRLCLFAALVGALTQSMVDGVIVMPNSQLWLALIIGWLLGLHAWRVAPSPLSLWGYRSALALSLIAVVGLIAVMARDVPDLAERNQQFMHDHDARFLQPRFWAQGVIALPGP